MSTPPAQPSADRVAHHADLFAELVVQHANMALIFCGAVPHPETGQPSPDLEAARLFIDRLEMLQAKTRGNVGAEEAGLLAQSLAAARMAFVQAVAQAEKPAPEAAPAPAAEEPAPAPTPASPSEGESRKKFVKKY
ncbi:MAG: hypothetical protein RJA22_2496 [Verrucomicrobiota bacterium]